MTPRKVLEAVCAYRALFEKSGIEKIEYPHDRLLPPSPTDSSKSSLGHCYGMLDKIEAFVAEERIEKAFRWLGFVQGCVWSQRLFTLEELKDHNKPG